MTQPAAATPSHFRPVALGHASRLINHGPTVLVTSAHGTRRNVMAAAWSMPVEFTPPRIAVVIDKQTFTRELVAASGAFGLCIPGSALADLVYAVGSESGRGADKFARYAIASTAGPVLGVPLIEAGCSAWLECRLISEPHTEDAYDTCFAEVLSAAADERIFAGGHWDVRDDNAALHTLHHLGAGNFVSAGAVLRARPLQGGDMITLYGFGRIFPEGHGETKDLWVQWAIEETGLPYRVHALDHTAGELDGEAYGRISPFRQAPVIDDDGFVLAESAAIVLYLADKAGRLIPADAQGRSRVVQWCFAAVGTLGTTLVCIDVAGMFDGDKAAPELHTQLDRLAGRWLGHLERHLQDREWIACADFTVADVMMAGVLRGIRKTELMAPFPRVEAYFRRCLARPAWQRTLALYAERLGVDVDDIR